MTAFAATFLKCVWPFWVFRYEGLNFPNFSRKCLRWSTRSSSPPFSEIIFVTIKLQMQPPEAFYKKAVLKYVAIFTKNLYWSLFKIKLQAFRFRTHHMHQYIKKVTQLVANFVINNHTEFPLINSPNFNISGCNIAYEKTWLILPYFEILLETDTRQNLL